MTNEQLSAKIKRLELTVAKLREGQKKETLDEQVLDLVLKTPLTIEEIAKELKVTRNNANGAVRRLAFDEKVIMVSEKGKRKARFRVFHALWIKKERPKPGLVKAPRVSSPVPEPSSLAR